MNTKETAPMASGDAKPFSVEEPVNWYLHHAAATSDRAVAKELRNSARDEYMRQFGQRCKLARGSMQVDDVASMIGVHRNTIWNIERGQSLPDAFELEVIAKAYKTTLVKLLEGVSDKSPSASRIEKSVRAVEQDGFVYVPLFNIKVSAGNGAFSDIEAVITMRPFDANYIRYELGIAHNNIAMTTVIGTSMEPWLHSKDTVLTDLNDCEVVTEGVHIVRLDGALLVKKLQRLPGKVLRVSSFNPAYEPFDIQGHEDADRDFAVIGRVRWGGVTFN